MKRSEALERTYEMLVDMHQGTGLLDSRIERIIVRPEWNIIAAEGGLCAMVINFYGKYSIEPDKQPQFDEFRALVGRTLSDVSKDLISANDENLRSIGVCSLAALSQPFLTPGSLYGRGHGTIEDMVSMVRPSDRVTVVGFGAIVNAIRKRCHDVHVTEMRPRHFIETYVIDDEPRYVPGDVEFHDHTENGDVIRSSDVVFMTASSLVNGTFDDLLSYCKDARLKGIYGPSGSVIPDGLFELGVDFTRTLEVTDPSAFMHDAIEAHSFENAVKEHQRRHWSVKGDQMPTLS